MGVPSLELAQVLEVQIVEIDGCAEEQQRWLLGVVDGAEARVGGAQVGEDHARTCP